MARTKEEGQEREPYASPKRKSKPVKSQEARERQLTALAMDVAEKQMREGKVSSQVLTHFLKLGTVQAELELEKTKHENELLRAKTETLKAQENSEKKYNEVIEAMKKYSGSLGQ